MFKKLLARILGMFEVSLVRAFGWQAHTECFIHQEWDWGWRFDKMDEQHTDLELFLGRRKLVVSRYRVPRGFAFEMGPLALSLGGGHCIGV